MIPRVRFRLPIAIAFGALVVSASAAPASQTVARAGGEFGPDDRSSRHPKKAFAEHSIPDGFSSGPDGHRLCTAYERSSASQDGKGSLTAKVEILRDGASIDQVSVPKANVSSGRAGACTTSAVQLQEGDQLSWTFTFKKMPKIPSGETMSYSGEVLAPEAAFGRFHVVSDGRISTPFWIDGPHTLFCSTDAGFADLWIRFAADDAANGENGPHIDIDVCNYQGGGSHSPLDTESPSCGGDKTFDIFWHDAEGDFFVNRANASECELAISDGGGNLEGTFSCAALEGPASGATVDVLGGAFRCAVD